MVISGTRGNEVGQQIRGFSEPGESLLSAYLFHALKVPLLGAAEEAELARQWEQARAMSGIEGETGRFTPEERETLKAGHTARHTIIEANLRLVVCLARQHFHFGRYGLSLLDLVQEGNIGLMHAVDKYDWRLGYRFSTYASWWVRRAIERAIADHGRVIRLPVHIHDSASKLAKATAEIALQTGCTPDSEAVASALGLSRSQAALLQRCLRPVLSLDQPTGDDGEGSLNDVVIDADATAEIECFTDGTLGDELDELLQQLGSREREIIRRHYGLDGIEPCTLEQVGSVLGITRERARQIEARALSKLRRHNRADSLRDYFGA